MAAEDATSFMEPQSPIASRSIFMWTIKRPRTHCAFRESIVARQISAINLMEPTLSLPHSLQLLGFNLEETTTRALALRSFPARELPLHLSLMGLFIYAVMGQPGSEQIPF